MYRKLALKYYEANKIYKFSVCHKFILNFNNDFSLKLILVRHFHHYGIKT